MMIDETMRNPDVESQGGPSLKVRIPPNARFGKSVRDEVVTFANRHDISRTELDEFIFAIGEALANAIEHSGSEDVIEIRCRIEGNKIIATVIDSGKGFESSKAREDVTLPNEFSERGRGLPIMQRFTDIFSVNSVPGKGTAVVLGRYLREPGSGSR
ncbi:MAG: ATP-binding protein [Candidatus Eremiobacteraeota bacterium]|nr:ATP-binding protein [Candidatus Eremiobacteraeota bacterium]